jgi:hypothetical protein
LSFLEDLSIGPFHLIDIRHDSNFDDQEHDSDVRLSCFAHTMQLCIRDGLRNAAYVPKILAKCQTLAKFSHKSSKMADLLEQLNVQITRMNVTRWNSEFLLIKSISSIGKTDLEAITSVMDNPVKFSNNDLTILEEIIEILQPFYEISIKCQAEIAVTASLVVPSVVHLISHLRDIKAEISFCTKLVQQLQTSINVRFAGITDRLYRIDSAEDAPYRDSLYFIASVLDPQFKFHWVRDLKLPVQSENHLKQDIIQLIIDEGKHDWKESSVKSSGNSSSSSSNDETPKVKRRKLFQYDDNMVDETSEVTVLDPAIELDSYLNDPIRTRFCDYWFHSPLINLKKMVKRVFSVQASSAPIERVFSHAGLILSSRRTNMSEQLFRDLVFLRVNQDLL